MRTGYDAVTPSNIPRDAKIVLGYIDGLYAWKQSDWNLFPKAIKIRIAVFASTNDGDVLDCESGDATPAQCPGWVKMRRAAGHPDPAIYCSEGSATGYQAVKNAFLAQGVPLPQWWIAGYPGSVGWNLYPFTGCVAHQVQDYQEKYDISVIADYWNGIDSPQQGDFDMASSDDVLKALNNINESLIYGNRYAMETYLTTEFIIQMGRPIDPDGDKYWYDQLHSGVEPQVIRDQLYGSDEAKAHRAQRSAAPKV